MQLQQIQTLDLQIAQRVLDIARQSSDRVAGRDMGSDLAPRFGRDDHIGSATRRQDTADQPFGSTIAIDIGRVDEIDTAVQCLVEGCLGVLFRHITPAAADRPGAKADRRNLPAGLPENALFHDEPRSLESFNPPARRAVHSG